MGYKINIQKTDTNELVQSLNLNANDEQKAMREYHHHLEMNEERGVYFTLMDNDDKAIFTSNEAIGTYINTSKDFYAHMPFNFNSSTQETPAIYIAVDCMPFSEGIQRLAEKMADVADVCFIATSTKENIKPFFDYIRENVPSVNAENIFFVPDDEKDKSKYIKSHHENPKDVVQSTRSHAEISILLSNSEKDLKEWSEKGGTAIQLVDELHLKTNGTYVDVNLEKAYHSEEHKEHIINGCCIGVLREYDNLMIQTINNKQLDIKYTPIVGGQFSSDAFDFEGLSPDISSPKIYDEEESEFDELIANYEEESNCDELIVDYEEDEEEEDYEMEM